MEGITFKMHFKGIGFGQKLDNKDSESDRQPNQFIITELSGKGSSKNLKEFFFILIIEPGYVSTSKIVLNCAIVLLSESDKIKIK